MRLIERYRQALQDHENTLKSVQLLSVKELEARGDEAIYEYRQGGHGANALVEAASRVAEAHQALIHARNLEHLRNPEQLMFGKTGREDETLTLTTNEKGQWILLFENNDDYNNTGVLEYGSYELAVAAFYEHVSPEANPMPEFTLEEILKWDEYAGSPDAEDQGRVTFHKYYGLYAYVWWNEMMAQHADNGGTVKSWGLQ